MANEINKLESLGVTFPPTNRPKTPAPETKPSTSIAVSPQLVSLLAEEEPARDSARIMQLKQQVSSGNYSVDVDALAEKLTQTLIANTNGI